MSKALAGGVEVQSDVSTLSGSSPGLSPGRCAQDHVDKPNVNVKNRMIFCSFILWGGVCFIVDCLIVEARDSAALRLRNGVKKLRN